MSDELMILGEESAHDARAYLSLSLIHI